MIVEKEGSITGAQDIELNQPRNTPLKFFYTLPETLPAKGLVFLIDGFGTKVNSAYNRLLCRHISKKYGLICVKVIYHAYCSRPTNGGAISVIPESCYELSGKLLSLGHNIPFNPNELQGFFDRIDILELDAALNLKALIQPAGGDYQNFGVMQAIDHLLVLEHLMKQGELFDLKNILLFGSSHGAYLGHLLLKMAPNTFSGLIDNSAYVQAPLGYLGQETEFVAPLNKNINLHCSVVSPWNFNNEKHPQFYSPARFAIRDLLNKDHLKVNNNVRKRTPIIEGFVSNCDAWVPLQTKSLQYQSLNNYEIESNLTIISDTDLDGKKFKTLAHGMGAGLQELFDDVYPNMNLKPGKTDFELATKISLPCYDKNYCFDYSGKFNAYVSDA